MKATFTIPGEPKPKGRPRSAFNNGKKRIYTPEPTATYENYVKYTYHNDCGIRFPDDTPLQAIITAEFAIPKATSNKRKQDILNGNSYYTKKIDTDNIAKTILDALNGVAYRDDSQITDLIVKKRYGEIPKVHVEISEINSNNTIN